VEEPQYSSIYQNVATKLQEIAAKDYKLMYDINNELDKIGLLMQKTAYDFEATKDLSAKVNNGYIQLLQEKSVLIEKLKDQALNGEATLRTAQKLENVTDFIYYLKFRKDLIEDRLQKLKNVHPSRIDNCGNVLPWDTEESLLSWRKRKPKMLG
jgi:hypothetical protein